MHLWKSAASSLTSSSGRGSVTSEYSGIPAKLGEGGLGLKLALDATLRFLSRGSAQPRAKPGRAQDRLVPELLERVVEDSAIARARLGLNAPLAFWRSLSFNDYARTLELPGSAAK